eukprot:Seg1163.4 transcript_id=Seg1163.4/GoldUCD/mRNA.D3Y31 product="hypothetical protein" protein_id=Seg1163.4/GoldUCD/D3Y31
MSQICAPVLTQICAPVPHSKFIQTITRCAQNTWCGNYRGCGGQAKMELNTNKSNYCNTKDMNNNMRNELNAIGDIQDTLMAILDSADRMFDGDALLELAYDLGLDNDKFELPDLKSGNETSILSCLR